MCLSSAQVRRGWRPRAWPQNAAAPGAGPSPLRVVSDDNYPPYLFKGPDGKVQGYLVDLWALWERKTGRRVMLTATNWARAQQMLQGGEADVIDMIFRTPAREPFHSFSEPYADVPVAMYAHQSIGGIQSPASLAGFRVGVQEGDACSEHLRAKGITDVVTYTNYQSIINAAVGQQIKLFCMDQYPGDHYLYRNQLHKDYPKAFDLYVGQFHRAVRRDNTAMLSVVEAGMAQITPAELEALQKKWLRAPFDWHQAIMHSTLVLVVLLAAGAVLLLWVRSLQRAVRVYGRGPDESAGHRESMNHTVSIPVPGTTRTERRTGSGMALLWPCDTTGLVPTSTSRSERS